MRRIRRGRRKNQSDCHTSRIERQEEGEVRSTGEPRDDRGFRSSGK